MTAALVKYKAGQPAVHLCSNELALYKNNIFLTYNTNSRLLASSFYLLQYAPFHSCSLSKTKLFVVPPGRPFVRETTSELRKYPR
jgi:hypothetical protein